MNPVSATNEKMAEVKTSLETIKLYSFHPGSDFCAYTITLAPGIVRYLTLEAFLNSDVEKIIDQLRSLSTQPQINSPKGEYTRRDNYGLNLELVDLSFKDLAWETKLRVHHMFGKLYVKHKMPSCVYCCFHSGLGLKEIAMEECVGAWEKSAWQNKDVTASYKSSDEHITLLARLWVIKALDFPSEPCIFKKTSFVSSQLKALERKAERLKQAEQEAGAKQKDQEEVERLRKSNFRTFVYVMEDLRNGYFKIGQSTTPDKRERTLQSEVPQIVMRFSIPSPEENERKLHDFFAEKRIRGEWFQLTDDDLVWVVLFLKKHGDAARVSFDEKWFGAIAFNASIEAKREN